MEIIFYTNNSSNDKAVKNLTELARATIHLKDNDLLTDLDITLTNYYNANYVEMESKKYFVNNIRKNVNGTFTLSLHIDVLSTYYPQLQNKNFRVVRSSNIYNRFIIDNEQTFSSKEQLQTKIFEGTQEINNQLDSSTNCFVLTVNNTDIVEEPITESEVV